MADLPTLTTSQVADLTAAPIVADVSKLDRPAWLQLRRAGLGGSDAAAVLGISKWESPYRLWLDKTARIEPDDNSTLAQRRGTYKEPFIITEAMVSDPELTVSRAPYMLQHPDHPVLLANVDGIATHRRRRGVGGCEAKDVHPFALADWADGPPPYYEAQVLHYMAVTGLAWWVVAADIGSDHIPTWYFEAHPESQADLVAAEVAWWDRYVVADVEPPVDGHVATTEALSLVLASPEKVRQLDPDEDVEVAGLFTQLAHDRAVAADAEASEAVIKNRLRQLLGDAEVLVDGDGNKLVTWKQQRPKVEVDRKAALTRAAYGIGVPVAELVADHTSTKPGNRPLVPTAGLNRLAKAKAEATARTEAEAA